MQKLERCLDTYKHITLGLNCPTFSELKTEFNLLFTGYQKDRSRKLDPASHLCERSISCTAAVIILAIWFQDTHPQAILTLVVDLDDPYQHAYLKVKDSELSYYDWNKKYGLKKMNSSDTSFNTLEFQNIESFIINRANHFGIKLDSQKLL